MEFYSPSRLFLLAQSPEILEALWSISGELQKTYIRPTVMTYVPCVGEVCIVQFSSDMVRRCLLEQFHKFAHWLGL